MKSLLTFLSALLFSINLFASFGDSEIDKEKANVLIINSYHKGFLWTDNIVLGIEEALSKDSYELHIEYMDTKRQFDSTYQNLLANLLQYKHQKHNYQLIIISDNNAFEFIKSVYESIFSDVPIVFCGLNYFQEKEKGNIKYITGVNEKADLKNNIALIQNNHPSAKEILVVTDNTPTGKIIQKEVKSLRKSNENIRINLAYNLSAKELKEKMQGLTSETVVLYTLFFRDKNNVFFEFDEGTRLVCSNASVPVYGTWNFSMGYGIVGGYLTRGYDQGKMAGKKALQCLSGIPINEIPIHQDPISYPVFDFQKLKLFSINEKLLPAKSIITNRPKSFIQKNKRLIRNLFIIVAFLLFLLLVLSYVLRRTQKIKKELRSSENRLRTIIDALPSMIFIKNKEGKFLAVNKTLAASYGKHVSEVEGQYQINLHPDKDEVQLRLEEDRLVLESDQSLNIQEHVFLDAYGQKHWLQTIKAPCQEDLFGEEAVIGISMDITQLKKAKNDLQMAQSFTEKVFETAHVIILTIDGKGIIKSINSFGEQLLGYKKEEIINANWINRFISSSDTDKLNEVFTKIINGKNDVKQYDNEIICKDGSRRLISWNNSVIRGEEGKTSGLLSIGVDITEQHKTLLELKNSENKFRNIFDYSPFGIMYYDAEGILMDCNESFSELVESSKEKLLGLQLLKMPDKNLVKGVRDSLTIGVGEYNGNYQTVLSNKLVPVRAAFSGIKNPNGKYIGGIAMTEDISKQKEAEDSLIKANKELLDATVALKQANNDLQLALENAKKSKALEEANAMLTRQTEELNVTIEKLKDTQIQLIQAEKMASVGILTSGIAHEINNPLNFIQGGKTALELYVYDNLKEQTEKFKPYFEMIDTGIERAVEIIQSLNRFNRRSDTYDEVCNLAEIIDNCLVMTHSQLKHKVVILKDYTNKELNFKGNEGKVHQVILNIITNAEQAIHEKGSIKIAIKSTKSNIIASFTDNGSGIKQENLEKVSDPFFTTKDPGKGTGLGLSIAYNIMQEHKGSINFESVYGEGTTVTLTFPKNI